MTQKFCLLIFILLIFSLGISTFGLENKRAARVIPLNDEPIQSYSVTTPRFSTAEICTVRHDVGPIWAIVHWMTGAELYKSYQNPAEACTGPYPYSVEEIYFVIYCDSAFSMTVSVDVESVDLTDPECPWPGYLLSISGAYSVDIPGKGLYQIAVPLDSPAVVDGPYFAGFYIDNLIDSLAGVAPVTDSVRAKCVSYNIWDTTIGYVDLDSVIFSETEYYIFPGRLLLFSSGTTGGGGGEQPEPSITILSPEQSEQITGLANIWAVETAGSDIIDYVRFEYRSDVDWFEIGSDYDGSRALRNGVDTAGSGTGYSQEWDYSGLTEGTYWLRATVYDTLGRTDADSFQVAVDPTPPHPLLTNPTPLDTLCLPTTLTVTSDDENLSNVVFEQKTASTDYEVTVATLDQSAFADYYCGPVAAAIAMQYWFDRGFIYIMREGNQYLSIDTVVERMAANMLTNRYSGTYDDMFYYGLQQYIITHGNELRLGVYWHPDYNTFQSLFQEQELLPILGLGGTAGLYLVAAGVSGLEDSQGRYPMKASDPLTGTIIDIYIRNSTGGAEVWYDGSWHSLDVVFAVWGWSHSVTRTYIGLDNSSAGGWTYNWSAGALDEDSLYFITATANDPARSEKTTALVQNNCFIYTQGDLDGNGSVDIGDALMLIDFIYKGTPEPVGGAARADANCDGNIDISDVVAFIKYIYGVGTAPCY